MNLRVAFVILSLALMMRPAACQEKAAAPRIDVLAVETGQPVKHLLLCDLDGDGHNDLVFVTRTDPALCVWARRAGASGGFEAPRSCELPSGSEGIFIQPGPEGAAVLSLSAGRTTALPRDRFGPLRPAPLPEGRAPEILGFAADLDGDRVGDPLAPVADGFDILLTASGRRVAVRPPVARERSAGVRGLVSERARFPLVSLETLAAGEAPRPCFFARDALLALRGSLESGFGPDLETILRVPSTHEQATLERTEARLLDIAGAGGRDLLVVRTRSQAAALAQVRTEMIFYRLGADGPVRPKQAILLPGILSSGPDVRDVDGDGRPDLFLSVFGEDITQQVTRRITGRARIDYLLYRGTREGLPFARSPEWTETDSLPEALFSDWGLRHRLMIDDDWTADGLPDLVQMAVSEGATRIDIRGGRMRKGSVEFPAAAVASAQAPVAVKDHRPWRLSAMQPAILCRTATGALIFAPAR